MYFLTLKIPICGILVVYSSIAVAQSFNATVCRSKLASPRSHVAVAYDGLSEIIYIFGGVSYTPNGGRLVHDEIHRFNITSDEIEVVGRLPKPAYGGRAHVRDEFGDILYLPNGGTHLWSFNLTTGIFLSAFEWPGSSSHIGLTFVSKNRVLSFGGLDDPTAIYSVDLQSNSQNHLGNLPLKSELVVSMHYIYNQSTLIFAGEVGTYSPVLMEYSHKDNTTTILPWEFPSFKHGEGSTAFIQGTLIPTMMYVIGAVVTDGTVTGDCVIKVILDPPSRQVMVVPLVGVPEGLTSTSAVYVRLKSMSVFFFGGHDQYNEYQDSIWYI